MLLTSTLIIHQVLNKKTDCHDSIWISGLTYQTFLLFYISDFFSILVLIEKMCETLKTVFDYIFKYLQVLQNTLLHVKCLTLFAVFGNVAKRGLSCLAYHLRGKKGEEWRT